MQQEERDCLGCSSVSLLTWTSGVARAGSVSEVGSEAGFSWNADPGNCLGGRGGLKCHGSKKRQHHMAEQLQISEKMLVNDGPDSVIPRLHDLVEEPEGSP